MNIRNSKEIIQNILERYNFTAIYSDSCNKFGIETSKNYADGNDAIDFLYSSAVIGSKSLGFFTELPFFEVTRPLRAECLFITQTLPKYISTPVIIIKNAEDISARLTLAVKLSVEHKIPVTVVITHNADNNLMQVLPANLTDDITLISLQHKGCFPEYFVPEIKPDVFKILSNDIYAYSSEKDLLEQFFFNNYSTEFDFKEREDKIYPQINNLLCPGCPFVNIFARGVEKDTIIFTDITCKGVLETFPELNYLTIDGYMGIISSEVRSSTLFIGKASSYKSHYNNIISKRGRVILLNDSGVAKIDGFSSIRHPKKLNKIKNTLYPYSCNNIKKYSKVKIKLHKCSCIKNNAPCSVFEKTLCPAIYTSSNDISIDNTMCNGCLACKLLCSQGAVS